MTDGRDEFASAEERLAADLADAVQAARDDADASTDDEALLRSLNRRTDRLHAALVAVGELRGSVAMRLKDRTGMSFTKLGGILDVTRARAAEIVSGARRQAGRRGEPVIALAVVTHGNRVLVAKRTDGQPPWVLPGGETHEGESAEDAAVREVAEETGATVRAVEVIGRRVHPLTHRTMAYVACDLVSGPESAHVADAGEIAEVRWADLTDAHLLMPSMFKAVAEFLARKIA